jgi:arylformamidase
MSIYDISLPISESLVTWPGQAPVSLSQISHLERGDTATVSHLQISVHGGTHVDAPAHFIRGGAGVETLDLDILTGPALVVHVPEVNALTGDIVSGLPIPPGVQRVLFRTRNSEYWVRAEREFKTDFVAVTDDAAHWLIEHGVRLVGVDYLSVAPFDALVATHQTLLGDGVVVVEGLNLSQIAPGIYEFVCLPLKIVGSDGAPARAILRD